MKIKISLFIVLFIVLSFCVGRIMIPKWYYPDTTVWESETRIITGFYEEPVNTIDVIFMGTSHVYCGISPMEIYGKTAIKSYDLSSANQPIQVTYYLFKEALKTQQPEILVYDVSGLFTDYKYDDARWRYAMDQMPLSFNKIKLAKEYAKQNKEFSFWEAVLPIWGYHSRWNELDKKDFTDFTRNKHYYSKGYCMGVMQRGSGFTPDEMNEDMELLKSMNKKFILEYASDFSTSNTYSSELYSSEISSDNWEWLLKLKLLCEEHNVQLLLTKIPSVKSPISYSASWTIDKYRKIKSLCDEANIDYFDMLYEMDIDIDWCKDTMDSGAHLNILGAVKVSECISEYLTEEYRIQGTNDLKWDNDLEIYKKLRNLAFLELESEFAVYLDKLMNKYDDKIIIFSAADEMSMGLNEDEKAKLEKLGLHADFNDAAHCSYIAIIKNNNVVYEAISNYKLNYQYKLQEGILNVESAGYYAKASSVIKINEIDFSQNSRGLNIVVYDEQSNLVLDSVCFDTFQEHHTCVRDISDTALYFRAYESYIID